LPRPAIRLIAQHLIKNGSFLQVQNNLALNRHWYDVVMDPSLETHLKLFVKASSGKTRNGFEKLREMLVTFEPKQGLKYLKHLEFTNFHNHMNKTMDILNDRNFDLNSLVIQTSTIGNIKTLSAFSAKHCNNLERLSLSALRLPPKGLPLFFSPNKLNITHIKLFDVGPILPNINWEILANLKHLDIFFSQKSAFSMGSSIILSKINQSSLRYLQLANISIDERRLETTLNRHQGFPNLRYLSLRRSFIDMSQTVNVLLYLCKNTDQLEEIDLQGCNKFDFNDISCALGPITNRTALRRLDLTGCNGKYGLGDLFLCPNEKPKLEYLNLSSLKLKEDDFYQIILQFINENFHLKHLDLSKTSITAKQVLQILTGHHTIENLNLTGVGSVPRGWKRELVPKEFPRLVKILKHTEEL